MELGSHEIAFFGNIDACEKKTLFAQFFVKFPHVLTHKTQNYHRLFYLVQEGRPLQAWVPMRSARRACRVHLSQANGRCDEGRVSGQSEEKKITCSHFKPKAENERRGDYWFSIEVTCFNNQSIKEKRKIVLKTAKKNFKYFCFKKLQRTSASFSRRLLLRMMPAAFVWRPISASMKW